MSDDDKPRDELGGIKRGYSNAEWAARARAALRQTTRPADEETPA